MARQQSPLDFYAHPPGGLARQAMREPGALPHNLIAAGDLPAQPCVASLAIQTFGKKPLA
jgi:hypothetical protein